MAPPAAPKRHPWKFYRSGGVDQVALETRDDLAHLGELDPKLWLALSMPTRGVEIDPRTLDLLDTDQDGHIRHPEIIAALSWAEKVYKDLGDLLVGGDAVALDRLSAGPVLSGARRLLANLDMPDARVVTLADATNAEAMFAKTLFNGDGVVPAEAATGELRQIIDDIITTHGSLPDRSGKPGIDEPRVTAFFTEARAMIAWHDLADRTILPLGEATAAAAGAVDAVRDKVEDFYTRGRLAAFDQYAAGLLSAGDAAFAALSTMQLSSTTAEIANLPLAKIEANAALPLTDAVNPAWRARLTELAQKAVAPLIGERTALTAADWQIVLDKLAAHETWRAAKPTGAVEPLGIARLRAILAGNHEAGIADLLAQDLAVKPEIDSVGDVEKLCRYQRDLATVLNNYVNFSQFYGRKGGVFQAGTLFLDGRGCNLVFEVTDAAKHATMAPMAGAYIAYCDCVRPGGLKKPIAAAFTAGEVDNLMVGRNGVFVDRKGNDWEATITKVIDNPISIRQAFWSPYKKLVRLIEERVAKRAAAADAAAQNKLGAAAPAAPAPAGPAATAPAPAAPAPAAPAPAAPAPAEPKGMDIGTVAAIGVAVGGIGAFVTAGLAAVFGLGPWMPIGIVAILLLISGPAMVLAFIKLRRRNLGPLLDANGWAINVLTRINVPFGTALTDLPRLPPGAKRSLKDPYAEKRRPWGLYLLVIIVLAIAIGWFTGRLDKYLPAQVQSTKVLAS